MKRKLLDVWKNSDDAIQRIEYLSDIYSDVPKSIANTLIEIVEFHFIRADKKTKKKVIKFLNEED